MSKVNFIKVNTANVTANNSYDESKKYEISCYVNINGTKVQSIDRGQVVKEETEIATFSKWNEQQLNVNFNTSDVTEMCSIITEVNAFYSSLVDAVAGEPIKI